MLTVICFKYLFILFYFCSTPHANLEFEGRGGDDFASDVSQILMQVCNNDNHIDLKKLCVIAGEQVWALYVDIMVSIYYVFYICTIISLLYRQSIEMKISLFIIHFNSRAIICILC